MATRVRLSRQDAITLGAQRYFTGIPCLNGHVAERYTSANKCCACSAGEAANWRRANPEKSRESCRQWARTHRQESRRASASWRERNPEKNSEAQARWKRENPDKNAAKEGRRRARKLGQTPQLTPGEQADIRRVYAEARRLSGETGVAHEVDHMTPLARGGLHHPDNLQILTAASNASKGVMTADEYCLT